ncbi:hypothetical protein ADUPG1_012702 [Aduncisulcus paluster]|uniref:Protein kinase domain-containing protein n=1 Tax=Aduncisulcus paluster TaxID=2918883 RepID=A0ABQ5K0D0_9EUKA|nr:hypothetical protein ADUPG1_012702 [Aduncisulcus paluster]
MISVESESEFDECQSPPILFYQEGFMDDTSDMSTRFFCYSTSAKSISRICSTSIMDPKKPKEKKPKRSSSSSHPPKDYVITSAKRITPLCVLGSGGFGEVLLVHIDGIPKPLLLKKLLQVAEPHVISDCKHEFKAQRRLFMDPKCHSCIPRPMYIIDLLDRDTFHGMYGFCMEYCIGGSVKEFVQSWARNDSYLPTSVRSHRDLRSTSPIPPEYKPAEDICDPMTLHPAKVAALCVGMIECLSLVFKARKDVVHRDVKPDNFFIRRNEKGECRVVLGDFGFVKIRDSVNSSVSSKIFSSSSQDKKDEKPITASGPEKEKDSPVVEESSYAIRGTFVYNSYESLTAGVQNQKSDAHSLGMSILSLFLGMHPFQDDQTILRISDALQLIRTLITRMEKSCLPQLKLLPLFRRLKFIEDRKYEPVYTALSEIYTGLTQMEEDERWTVHQAERRIRGVKHLLPEIGEGWRCPSIEDIAAAHVKKYGTRGYIM